MEKFFQQGENMQQEIQKSMSCRKVVVRHLPIIVSDGTVNEREKSRRSRIETLRDDRHFYMNGNAFTPALVIAQCFSAEYSAGRKCGFTLIELLVVVLIIGILAAVALPQYQKAVIRSRSRTMLSLGKTLSTAKEVYYLANGQYTADMRLLDVELPGSCTMLTNNGQYYKCGNYFLLDNNADHLVIDYCPENNGSYADCQPQRIFSFMFVAEHRTSLDLPSGIYCNVHNNSVVGQQICNMEIGAGMSFRSISY